MFYFYKYEKNIVMKKKIYVNRRYWYKNKYYQLFLFWIDLIGMFFFLFRKNYKIKKGQKIGILIFDHLGDALLSTPFISELSERFPGNSITVFCTDYNRDIFLYHPLLNQIVTVNAFWFDRKKEYALSEKISIFLKEAKKIQKTEMDWIFDLRGDIRHIWLMFLSKTPNRVGFSSGGLSFLLTDCRQFRFNKEYLNQYHGRNKLSLLTGKTTVKKMKLDFYLPAVHKFSFTEKPYFILHLGGGGDKKNINRFPEEMIYPIIRLVTEKNNLVITGLIEESDSIVLENNSCIHDCRGKFKNVYELARWTENAAGVFCSSTFILHIAGAFQVPTFTFYSFRDSPILWNPPGDCHWMVWNYSECSFCEKNICKSEKCIRGFHNQSVMKRAELFINKYSKKKSFC